MGLVGASMGGTASLVFASQSGSGIDAVVTLSAPDAIDGLTAGPEVVQAVDAAKLFIAGNVDGERGRHGADVLRRVGPTEARRDPADGRPRHRPPRGEPGRERPHPHHELAPATRARHMSRPIVFLTDYGTADEFVGVCHGVMLRIAAGRPDRGPDARDPPAGRDARRADARPRDLVHARRRGLRGGRRSGRGLGTPIDRRSRVLGRVPGRTRQRRAVPGVGGARRRRSGGRDHVRRRRPAADVAHVPRTRRVRAGGRASGGGHAARRRSARPSRSRSSTSWSCPARWWRRARSAPG